MNYLRNYAVTMIQINSVDKTKKCYINEKGYIFHT